MSRSSGTYTHGNVDGDVVSSAAHYAEARTCSGVATISWAEPRPANTCSPKTAGCVATPGSSSLAVSDMDAESSPISSRRVHAHHAVCSTRLASKPATETRGAYLESGPSRHHTDPYGRSTVLSHRLAKSTAGCTAGCYVESKPRSLYARQSIHPERLAVRSATSPSRCNVVSGSPPIHTGGIYPYHSVRTDRLATPAHPTRAPI